MLNATSANPRVCVVVPLLNEARFLRESMDSLLAQDYQPLEIIVYDGGSTDGSLEILKNYPVEVIVEPGLGQMAAINRGWKRTSAEFVTWWAGDDIYYPGAIRHLAAGLQSCPDAGIAHGDYDEIDEQGAVTRHFAPGDTQLRGVMDFNLIAPQASLIRRSALQQSEMLDENRRLAADLDLFLRLAQYFPTHYVRFTAAARRMHSGSEDAQDITKVYHACIDVIDSFFRRPDLTPGQRKLRARGLACARINLSMAYIVTGKWARACATFWQGVTAYPPILFAVARRMVPWAMRYIKLRKKQNG
jgi:glycosyltransferase involved in cell wall biosynthesis